MDDMLTRPCVGRLLLALVLLQSSACEPNLPSSDAATRQEEAAPDLSKVNALISADTNRFRVEHGLKELKENPELTKAAQYFADYLAKTDKFTHTADGSEPDQRAEK